MSSPSSPKLLSWLVVLAVGVGLFFVIQFFMNNASNSDPYSGGTVQLYFSHSEGERVALVGSPRALREDMATETILEQVVNALLKGPNHEESVGGLYSEIPKGTRLIDVTKTSEGYLLNVSTQFASGGGANSMQQRLAELSQTVQALNLEVPVTLAIEGKMINMLGGEGLEVPTAQLAGGEKERLSP